MEYLFRIRGFLDEVGDILRANGHKEVADKIVEARGHLGNNDHAVPLLTEAREMMNNLETPMPDIAFTTLCNSLDGFIIGIQDEGNKEKEDENGDGCIDVLTLS